MRKSAIIMPFFALLAGASGYFLRFIELRNVFDEQTGLPRRGAGITFALITLTVVFLIIIISFAINAGSRHTTPKGFENAFGTESLAYPLVFFIIGLLWLGSTAKYFLDVYALGEMPLSELIFSVLSALSAISVSLCAMEVYQDPRRKATLALSIVPTLFMCFWLILLYRRNASNPILLSYCYQCLAIITSTLGFYFTSGFVYSRPAPRKAIMSYISAIFFCFITLADDLDITIKLIFIAIIAINVVYSSMLLRNMKRKT